MYVIDALERPGLVFYVPMFLQRPIWSIKHLLEVEKMCYWPPVSVR